MHAANPFSLSRGKEGNHDKGFPHGARGAADAEQLYGKSVVWVSIVIWAPLTAWTPKTTGIKGLDKERREREEVSKNES